MACNLARKVTHARKRNPSADCDELSHRCRGPRRNHLCQLLWLSLIRWGVKFWVSPLTHVVALTTLALPCECVIIMIIINEKNAVYRHVNGKIAQLKQQISELRFYLYRGHCQCQRATQLKNLSSDICCFNCTILPLTCL